MLSERVKQFQESVIREMTRLCNQYDGINMSQGFPDEDIAGELKIPAIEAIVNDYNQYSYTWGMEELRYKIAEIISRDKDIDVDPDEELVITCGASEGIIDGIFSLVNPGDEVILFDPYYENYIPGIIMAGGIPVFVSLTGNNWELNEKQIEDAFSEKTKLIIINTPNNPTGKIFTRDEFDFIARLCNKYNVCAMVDETYEYMVYDDNRHVALGSIENMKDRTLTVSSFSKTFGITGWRVGYVAGDKKLMSGVRKVHDYLTVCAPTPFQKALSKILDIDESFYDNMREKYQQKRDYLCTELEKLGFEFSIPQGAYYVFAKYNSKKYNDDREYAEYLVKECGVAVVPGSSFYVGNDRGKDMIRFAFSRSFDTIKEAVKRLQKVS